jgi:hypothetical protein
MPERRPDVANVFWEPGETLRCLQCSTPILPREFSDGSSTFLIWFSSNEDPSVYCQEVTKDELPRFTFYKFCCEECCRQFSLRFGAAIDHAAAAHEAIRRARLLPSERFVLGGLFMGMPIEEANSIINAATGKNYRTRRQGDCVVLSWTSDIDYPCNPVVLRSSPLEGNPLVEFRLEENILRSVLRAYEPGVNLQHGTLAYLRGRLPMFHATQKPPPGRSRWWIGFPEKGVRIYACHQQAREGLDSPPKGSIVAFDLKRSEH